MEKSDATDKTRLVFLRWKSVSILKTEAEYITVFYVHSSAVPWLLSTRRAQQRHISRLGNAVQGSLTCPAAQPAPARGQLPPRFIRLRGFSSLMSPFLNISLIVSGLFLHAHFSVNLISLMEEGRAGLSQRWG